MPPLQAIQTTSIDDADLLGWPNEIGTIEPGKWAGIIAMYGGPLKDIDTPRHVTFVMTLRNSPRRKKYADAPARR